MSRVEMYSFEGCKYCVMAKDLLTEYGVVAQEHNVRDKEVFAAMKLRVNSNSVPQIFVDNQLVGGYTQLLALHNANKLRTILKTD